MRKLFGNSKIVKYAVAAAAIFIATCTMKLGDEPIGPSVNQQNQPDTTVLLTVTSTMTALKADGVDSAIITARLRDIQGTPLFGETIEFYNNIITGTDTSAINWRITSVTDSTGRTAIIYYGAKVNGTSRITVVAPKHHDTAYVNIVLSGVNINLHANQSKVHVGDSAIITAILLDGSGNPIIRGDSIVFSTATGRFPGGNSIYRTKFDPAGQAAVKMTSLSTGTVMVRVSSVGINDSIPITFDSTSVVIVGARKFHISSSKTQLKADNSDTATVTATVVDQNNNPAMGDSIFFSCNIGIIGAFALVDSNGDAKVRLRAMPINGTCFIQARDTKTMDTASTYVLFSGITLTLGSDQTNLNINNNATVSAILKDGSGNPIGGDTVVFSTKQPGKFSNNTTTFRALLDPTGRAEATITSNSATRIDVSASCLNSGDTITLFFTNNAITLTSAKRDTALVIGGNDSTLLTATYLDSTAHVVSGATVTFYANAGTITKSTAVTDINGHATTWLKSANFSGTATVEASITGVGNALATVTFAAAKIKSIKLTITPDNISINGGVATLSAIVRDINDNLVNLADVNFKILNGPGGGEYIDKPVATTSNGKAGAQLYAGSVPSMYRGVLVSASVHDTIADSCKITISGEPYAISVAYPNEDTVTVPDAGHLNATTFDYFMGAVVCDINGNPVADGTRVNFSAVVTGMAVHRLVFAGWSGLGSGANTEVKPKYAYNLWDIPFEDINNNFHRDQNDLTLQYGVGRGYVTQNPANAARGDDVNGDGHCDFDPTIHDLWYDFNDNGKVDTGLSVVQKIDSTPRLDSTIDTACYDTIIHLLLPSPHDTAVNVCHLFFKKDTIGYKYDTTRSMIFTGAEPYITVSGAMIWADLYPDGVWNTSELVRDVNGNGRYDIPASGDRRWWEYENLPYWRGLPFNFDQNDYGIAITTSATTTGGVANVELSYPRELARRLIVSVNVESNGVRDRTGARFVLPVISNQ
ncbi:MAG: Ig-like domain-containing protein [Chitinispirillaceae bacterium]